MGWWSRVRTAMFGGSPVHEVAGHGRRSTAWQPSNPGAIAALVATGDALRIRSRDLVRRNAWANAAIEAFVANAVGTGIKPQSLIADQTKREALHALWRDFVDEADAAGLTDLYGLQALGCRALLEGGECLVRLRPRRPEDGLAVPLQLQVLEPEHLPLTLNREEPNGNVIRAGIEFNRLGRRVAYHLYLSHPQDGSMAPMSRQGGLDTFRVPATEVLHIFRPLRPGQIRGEPWLARALVKLNELDQYDDAELVRKKTAAMFAGFITRDGPEDPLPGDAPPDEHGTAPLGLEPGSLQILEAGESVTFAQPADVGASYDAFLRSQFRAVAAAMGITYEQLTGDLTGVNYSSIRAGLLEFRRRCEMVQHSVLVFQLCRPIWNAFVDAAVLSGAIELPGYRRRKRQYRACKWVPQGWSWVDPEKEFNAMILAIRAGLLSRSEAIASSGYDAETIDREIAADAQRADSLGLVLDTDPRLVARNGVKHAPPPADSAAFDTKPTE